MIRLYKGIQTGFTGYTGNFGLSACPSCPIADFGEERLKGFFH
jgi:hypothetical protein